METMEQNKNIDMKKIIKTILGLISFLLIPGAFGGVAIGVYLGFIRPPSEAKNILRTGIETTAAVINVNSTVTVSSSSGSTTRKERYYYLKLAFVNSEGDKIEYKTRSIYPEEFIRRNHIESGGTVRVMYVGAEAVVKGFVPKYETWLWLFPVVFGAIAAGFLLLFIYSLKTTAGDYIIRNYGAAVTGRYLEKKKLIKSSEFDLYSITCIVKNDYGDTSEVQTRFIYSNSDAEKLAEIATFPVIYKGKRVIIVAEENNNKR